MHVIISTASSDEDRVTSDSDETREESQEGLRGPLPADQGAHY